MVLVSRIETITGGVFNLFLRKLIMPQKNKEVLRHQSRVKTKKKQLSEKWLNSKTAVIVSPETVEIEYDWNKQTTVSRQLTYKDKDSENIWADVNAGLITVAEAYAWRDR